MQPSEKLLFSKTKLLPLVIVSVLSVMTLGMTQSQIQPAYAVECEDIKGEMDWGGESHGDNDASEKKFNNMVEGSATICEIAKCYDHVECEGTIEDHEWDEFQTSIAYEGTSDDVQDCLDDRMDLGNELKDYEIHHCAVGSY